MIKGIIFDLGSTLMRFTGDWEAVSREGVEAMATWYLKKKHISMDNLGEILDKDNFHGYHPLIEKTQGLVAQAEHTVLVTSNGVRILT